MTTPITAVSNITDLTRVRMALVQGRQIVSAPFDANLASLAGSISGTTDITVTVGTGGDYDTIQEAYDALRMPVSRGATVTLQILGHMSKSTSGYTLLANNPYGKQIQIRGITPLELSLTGIVSVTGSAGAWSVTATLDDASGVAVGDFVRVKDVVPGYHSVYTYSGLPSIGEIRMPRVILGKLSTVTTAATVSIAALSTYVAQHYLVLAKGQCRRVSSINTEATFTMATGALADDIASSPGLNWWWYCRNSGSGTVAVSGTAVTGTSTTFETMYNPGDYIMIQNGTIGRVESITDDLNLVLEQSMGTVSSGKHHAPIIRGHHHEGGWRVTAVDGNEVTWTNTSQSAYAPPVVRVTGGDVIVLKSSIENTGAGSGVQTDTFVDIDDLAIVGDNGTGSFGINAYGDGRGKAGGVKLGPNTVILGYEYGFYGEMGTLYADEVSFCGAGTNGCYAVNGTSVIAVDAVANGNAAKGFVTYGNFNNLTGGRALGNGNDGLWVRQGHCLAESFVAEDNGRGGIWIVGTAGCEAVQCRIMGNAYGIIGENGGLGRFSGALMVGNTERALYSLFSRFEFIDANIVMNNVGVWARSLSDLKLEQVGLNLNTDNQDLDLLARIDDTLLTELP